MCSTCGDKGLVRINWNDAPEDFGLCLCAVGQHMRSVKNVSVKSVTDGFPLWMLWAQRERVDPSRIVKIEDVLTDDEMRARGFGPAMDDLAAIIAAGRK